MIPPVVAQGLAIASLVWGTPQCGQVKVEVHHFPEGDWSSGRAVIGGYTSIDPEYRWGPCVIAMPPSDFELDDRTICTVVVHEWGHLTGHLHSTAPDSPMNPEIPPYWRCDARNRAKVAGAALVWGSCATRCTWPRWHVAPTPEFTAIDQLVREGKLGTADG